jgi:DNA-binding MarR family transcriptional regulator
MADTGPETILFDVFLTNQRRKAMIARALDGTGLPPEDYPFYVFVGAEGPWTPTGLAARLGMPLSTVLFRVRRLERRGHAERTPNPEDGRSFLIALTDEGQRLLRAARPRFRTYAEAVEAELGPARVAQLRVELAALRASLDAQEERGAAADRPLTD